MPKELEGFAAPNTLIEHRGIRGGERPGKLPVKTPPRVRMPIKLKGEKTFKIDELVMRDAAFHQGVEPNNWAQEVKAIPVFALSDIIRGDEGVVYIERALYTGRGRLCSSAADDEFAYQKINVASYAKNKTIQELPKPRNDVKCTPDCPLWAKPGEKSDCRWRAITTCQLQFKPVFPSPVRHRTVSIYTIRAMITSLRFISSMTEGVLMGIPLLFKQSQIDVRDAKGEFRRIPVMHFDFDGTIQQLRHHAVVELESRNILRAAHGGAVVGTQNGLSYADHQLDGDESIADAVEYNADDEAAPSETKSARADLIEISSQIALLYKRLGYTKARQEALETKRGGDLDEILSELKSQSPDFNPSPGEPGPEGSVEDDVDDLFDDD
jgi:hypothetical protein